MRTTTNDVPAANLDDSCGDCPVANSRRAFLRDVGLAVAATLAAITLNRPTIAFAESVAPIEPVRSLLAERTYPIPTADGVAMDIDNLVILARWDNRVYGFSLKCPHKGSRLEWRASEQRIFCPKHKARFLATGSHISGRGSRALDRYAVRRVGNGIVVDLNRLYREDTSRSAWEASVITL